MIAVHLDESTNVQVRLAQISDLQGTLFMDQGAYEEALYEFSSALSCGILSPGLVLLHRAICYVRCVESSACTLGL